MEQSEKTLDMIVNLCKNRGYVFPGSEIYGGLANSWDYGPLGVEFKNNVKKAWLKKFVQESPYNVGLDAAIIMNPQTWVTTGHVSSFSDPLLDCRACKARHRADKLIGEEHPEVNVDAMSFDEMDQFIADHEDIVCPVCGKHDFTPIRKFNLMFKTAIGVTEDSSSTCYLRPETAQGIFVNFANIQRTTRRKLPFGVCQVGKAFRNEITPGNFTFRTREFEQMECEFFCKPNTDLEWFAYWKNYCENWLLSLGIKKDVYKRQHDISTTMPAPDFVGGGQILYDEAQMREVYENGRGSIKVRARYNVVPGENMLEITQIPPTTTVEAIMDKIAELVKAGKIKEISDMRDETDLNGLKLTLDLKRGVDPEKLMAKLYKTTPLEDSFSCNFNVLVSGQPRVMGVREILQEWTAFRMECVRRRTYYDLHGKEKRLHLLKGLAAILLDIDKAIHIIRTTEEETEVVPNLMIGFGIDEVQADYVAEIKLRHLNREYILKRTGEIEQLEKDIADLNDILAKPARIRRIIINELNDVAKKYAQPRRSEILYDLPEEESGAEEESIPDYPVTVFFTREGYLKKIPPQSLRTAGAHKLKEGDEIIHQRCV